MIIGAAEMAKKEAIPHKQPCRVSFVPGPLKKRSAAKMSPLVSGAMLLRIQLGLVNAYYSLNSEELNSEVRGGVTSIEKARHSLTK